MNPRQHASKQTKIEKRLKKAKFDQRHGRKNGAQRVKEHDRKLLAHVMKAD